jgi:hypothetical protein
MKVTIRAFTATGYHKDIAIMNEHQVLMSSMALSETVTSISYGHGVSVAPSEFPEVDRFEIIVE